MRNFQFKIPRWLLAVVAVVILILVGLILVRRATAAPTVPDQPINFKHQQMIKYGMDCMYCHPDAARSPEAGMPSVEKCVGCHRVIKPNRADIQPIFTYYNAGEPIPWVRITKLPRFVYFSHQAHVNNGVNCETCHGDVANMRVTVPVVNMTMGWCLDCHKKQANAPQLIDCIVCHQ